jgi:hypothetical protein
MLAGDAPHSRRHDPKAAGDSQMRRRGNGIGRVPGDHLGEKGEKSVPEER